MTSPAAPRAGVEECDTRVWLPGALLAELRALDGLDEVANRYECLLPAGHGGEHQALGAEVPSDMGHWVVWSGGGAPALRAVAFCPAALPTFDPDEDVSCQLPAGHDCQHLGYGQIDPDRPRRESVTVCW